MPDESGHAQEIKQTLWKKMAEGPYIMIGLLEAGQHGEVMAAQLDKDSVDTLWVFAHDTNRLVKGGAARVSFVSKGQDFFASMLGTVSIDDDRTMIDKLWNKQVEAWFDGGKSDPHLALIRFDISSAELWETDLSPMARLKQLTGGTVDYSESSSYAKVGTTAESSPS